MIYPYHLDHRQRRRSDLSQERQAEIHDEIATGSRPIWPHGIAFFFAPRDCRTCHGLGSLMGELVVRGRPPTPKLLPCHDCGGRSGMSAQVVLSSPSTPSGYNAARWQCQPPSKDDEEASASAARRTAAGLIASAGLLSDPS